MVRRSFLQLLSIAGLAGVLLSVGANWASSGQNQDGFSYGFGLAPANPVDYKRYSYVRIGNRDATDLPEYFTLEEYLPPIGNQGHTGSCVGWSTAYYCYSMTVARTRKLTPEQQRDPRFLFSPGFVWDQYNGGNSTRGMQIYKAFDVLAKMGCASLAEYPWIESAQPWKPSDQAMKKAEFYKAKETLILFKGVRDGDPADPLKMKKWLVGTKQPVVLGIPIFNDFPASSVSADFVYQTDQPIAAARGLHAVTIIGYDQAKQAFLMVNSWTEQWGNQGKLWLSEKFIQDYAIQGCAESPGGPRMRGVGLIIVPPAQRIAPQSR